MGQFVGALVSDCLVEVLVNYYPGGTLVPLAYRGELVKVTKDIYKVV